MHDINIEQNALIRIIDTNVLYRLLWIDWKQDYAYVYDINREKGKNIEKLSNMAFFQEMILLRKTKYSGR